MTSEHEATLPRHIGIIMDGNGRWAQKQEKPRTFGHSEGLKSAKEIIRHASTLKIQYITLYTFSTENWKRTEEEVGFLMSLIGKHLKNEMRFYKKNKIRIKLCGDISALPPKIQKEITQTIKKTSHFDGLTVILAINYGGRDEIIRAVKKLVQQNKPVTEEQLSAHLDNPEIPDPDLIIRTAGEQRLSNFLLWQSAYSEYYFTPTLWPDFTPKEFDLALESYHQRNRKFGGIK